MVGPHRTTALDESSWRPTQRAVREFGASAGVGPNYWIVGGGNRLCRSRTSIHSWRTELRCEHGNTEKAKLKRGGNRCDGIITGLFDWRS